MYLFLAVLEAGRSKTMVLANSVAGDHCSPLCPHIVERLIFLPLFIKPLIPPSCCPPLMASSNPNAVPKVYL